MSTITALELPQIEDREWTFDYLRRAIEKTEREYDTDVNWRRYEIVDGVLVVSPEPPRRHQLVVTNLASALNLAVADGFKAVGALAIGMGRTYRATDVTVTADRVFRSGDGPVAPADVLVAVEIESASSITTDRITKPAEYAAVGIPHYWRVELDPLRLTTYRLAGGRYEQSGSWGSGETVLVTEPFPVEFALDSLTV